MNEENPKTVKVAIIDLRHRQALWVLNKARGEEERNGMIVPPKRRGWGMAGGGVEEGEAEIEAAKREALEETGLEIELDESNLKLEPENHDGRHIVIVFATSQFSGEIHRRSTREIERVDWFPIYHPPRDAYSGDKRRYQKLLGELKRIGALR